MTVTAQFFAHYQDIVGARERTFTLPENADVRLFAERLEHQFPALTGLLTHGRVAVGDEFAEPETPLREGVPVAWMPPVSGGL